MKSVALVGFSQATMHGHKESRADEIWTVNNAWQFDVPRWDRLFDMHPIWHLTTPKYNMLPHWEWLQQEHDFPIYMMEHVAEVPASVRYPLEDVLENLGVAYMTSSASYMLGLALLEGFSRIEIYGLDMGSTTEYAYQKAGFEWLLGVAMGRGVEVVLPKNSQLMNAVLYGYDGGFQVISRQTLEHMLNESKNKLRKTEAQAHQLIGRYNEAHANAKTNTQKKRVVELHQQAQDAEYQRLVLDTTVQVYQYLIDHVDVKTPPELEVIGNTAVKSG